MRQRSEFDGPNQTTGTALLSPADSVLESAPMDGGAIVAERMAEARPGFAVLRLSGPLEMGSVPVFLKAVRAENAPVLILDFSAVTYLDSAGVGALVQILLRMRKESRKLALVNPNSRVRSVLEVTRVESQFVITPTVAEAEARLGAAG